MDYIRDFLVLNFPLLCIAVGMSFVVIFDFKGKRRFSTYILAILGVAIVLAIFKELEQYYIDTLNVVGATICALFGYSIRPIALYLFIRLASDKRNRLELLFLIPLGINFLVYSSSLFIDTEFGRIAFYYTPNEAGTMLEHNPGTLRFNYTSHLISLALLIYLIYESVSKLKSKHNADAFAILTCAFFVIIAVLVETFTSRTSLLNNTIGVSCMFYFMFMNNQVSRRDQLTGLFERKSFFADEKRFYKSISGIIQIDMNGLKIINDKQGHEMGDKALSTIGQIINQHLGHLMYGYRIGGDEFVVLCFGDEEKDIQEYISKVRESVSKTEYSCSIGYAIKNEEHPTFGSMMKASELEMYVDKDNFYKTNHIERRRK